MSKNILVVGLGGVGGYIGGMLAKHYQLHEDVKVFFLARGRNLEEIQLRYVKNPINTIDGVKIEFDNEWVHLRKSNTEPIIRIFAESESLVTADHLAMKIISDIKEIITE